MILINLDNVMCNAKKAWYFVSKIVLTYCEKKCSSDREELLKWAAERQEFTKVRQILVTECFF